jgi:hypothetical protein
MSKFVKFTRMRNFRKYQITGMQKQLLYAAEDKQYSITHEEANKLIAITQIMQDILNTWEENTEELKIINHMQKKGK